MKTELFPTPEEGFLIAQFLTVEDVKKSADFYVKVLNSEVVLEGEPTVLKVANTWIMVNVGGGPTADKPNTILHAPKGVENVSSFMSLFVADIHAFYQDCTFAGAEFITEPIESEWGWRCYMKDPDNYILEILQLNLEFFE